MTFNELALKAGRSRCLVIRLISDCMLGRKDISVLQKHWPPVGLMPSQELLISQIKQVYPFEEILNGN